MFLTANTLAYANAVAVVRDVDRKCPRRSSASSTRLDRRTPTLVGQTPRVIVRTSIGGHHARIHLSNEYGDRPLVIGSAHIAVRDAVPRS